jgi:tRNA(fMet)-specific endonuclease VapC
MIAGSIMVDTNIYIDLMKGDENIARRLEGYQERLISPIVWTELYVGAYKSINPAKHLEKVNNALLNTNKVALFVKGSIIPDSDMWIASAAIQHKLPLLTRDKHFNRIEGLTLS